MAERPNTAPHPVGDPRAEHPADRLLEESWSDRERRPGGRELVVEALAAALFLAVAVPLALPALGAHQPNPMLVLLLVGLYALVASSIRFPVGAGYLVPGYAILVPMLILLLRPRSRCWPQPGKWWPGWDAWWPDGADPSTSCSPFRTPGMPSARPWF